MSGEVNAWKIGDQISVEGVDCIDNLQNFIGFAQSIRVSKKDTTSEDRTRDLLRVKQM